MTPEPENGASLRLPVELCEDRTGNRYLGAPVPPSAMAPWREAFRAQVREKHARLLEDHKRTRDGAVWDELPDQRRTASPDADLEHHITLITPPELERLGDLPPQLPQTVEVELIGLGKVQDRETESWFVVAESAQAQQLRHQLGLGPHALHVTLGFTAQDIHHLPKDRSALVAAQVRGPDAGGLGETVRQSQPAAEPRVSVRGRISAGLSALQPSEQRVARFAVEEPERIVESTAQQLADLIGVSRTTVVRTCRSLGFTGYPQFRVALARESPAVSEPTDGETGLRAEARRITEGLDHAFDAVREEDVEQLVDRIVQAGRVVVVANGQSAPCAMDLSLRLTAAGRPAEFLADALAQQVSVRLLGQQDLCLAISSSGANDITLRSLQAAKESPAHLVLMTSQEESPGAELTDSTLLLVPPSSSFLESLYSLSRLHYTVAVEALAQQVRLRIGLSGQQTVDVLAENIAD